MKSKSCFSSFLILFWLSIALSGCGRADMSVPLDSLQVICHDDDAVILRSLDDNYVSGGELVYLKKNDSIWNLTQKINLKKYLHGGYLYNKNDWERDDNFLSIRSFDYNEKWLAIMVIPSRFIFQKKLNSVLIFKKDGDQWNFYKRLYLSPEEIMGSQIVISHDSILVQVTYEINEKCYINLGCIDLLNPKFPLKQEIFPPWNKQEQDMRGFPKVFVHDDQMLVSWRRRFSKDDADAFRSGEYKGDLYAEELVLYRWNGSRWILVQNLYDCYSRDILLTCYGNPTMNIQKVDWGQNEIYVYEALFGSVSKFVKKEDQQWCLAERIIGNKRDEKGHRILEGGEIGFQTPLSYNFVWRDKERRVGIVKPSSDGKMRVVDPDWLFDDADHVTSEKMISYYKTIGRPYLDGANIIIAPAGEKSFYELTDYIPKIDHSLCNQTLVTTYMFDECYFGYSPLSQADVWAGVNVYEIDPQEGPKRVFALTTSNGKELKVTPIDNPDPVNLQFPSRELSQE